MHYDEIVMQAKHLTLQEQMLLIEELMHGIRQSFTPTHEVPAGAVTPFSKLRGALKMDAAAMLDTDKAYIEHLLSRSRLSGLLA